MLALTRWGLKLALPLVLLLGLTGCSTQGLVSRAMADALAAQGGAPEDDPQLAREAAAFYLKLSESVLREQPGHGPLATAVASGFTQYSYAFVAFEADQLETRDVRAAQRAQARAARLYERAHRHAMAALEAQQPGFAARLAAGQPVALQRAQVPLSYWAAASWGAWISLSKDQPERVADLPQVMALAQLADRADDPRAPYDNGALPALLGTLEASRPGGSAVQAQRHFERARNAAQGRSAGVFVAEAEALALPAGNRPAFESLLRQALAAAQTHRNLANQVMRERAQWLLDTLDDRF